MEINYEISREECLEASKILEKKRYRFASYIVKGIFLSYLIIINILHEQSILNKIVNVIWPMITILLIEFFIRGILKIFDKKLLGRNIGKTLKFGKQKLVILDTEIKYFSDFKEYNFYKEKDWIIVYNINKYLYMIIVNEKSHTIVIPKDSVSKENIETILKLGRNKFLKKSQS